MKYLLIILFPFLLSAQNVWYVDGQVDVDRVGYVSSGRSWEDAWVYFDSTSNNPAGINWHIISAGDSIYVSGGEDSTTYYPAMTPYPYYGLTMGNNASGITFASGDPVVLCPSWEEGHNGEVWITGRGYSNPGTYSGAFHVLNLSNIKFYDFNFYTTDESQVIYTGSGDYNDSMYTFDNCYFGSNGRFSMFGMSVTRTTVENCLIAADSNALPNDQDLIGGGQDYGGNIINNNVFIYANTYVGIDSTLSADEAVVITETSLSDSRISMTPDYHIGNNISVGLYYLQITDNDEDTFYGDEWVFETMTITATAISPVFTSTSLDDQVGLESGYSPNAFVGAVIHVGSDSMIVTASSDGGRHLDGSGGWQPCGCTPTMSTGETYTITSNITPSSGSSWTMGGAHRDLFQIGMTGDYNNYRDNVISNNLILNLYEEGTGWNGILYSVGFRNLRWLIYNNIIVNQKTANMATLWGRSLATGSQDDLSPQTFTILNNTIITSRQAITFSLDTCIVKNNLFVLDATTSAIYGMASGTILTSDYNFFGRYGGFGSDDVFLKGAPYYTWTEWIGAGYDTHSDTTTNTGIGFVEKFGREKADYVTETGRDVGDNLWDEYPFLRTDALGNPRPESGTWDIGALEYQGSSPAATIKTVKGSNGKLMRASDGKFIRVRE